MIDIKFKKLHPEAKIPVFESEGAAAADVRSVEDITIPPGATIAVRLGFAIEILSPTGNCLKAMMAV